MQFQPEINDIKCEYVKLQKTDYLSLNLNRKMPRKQKLGNNPYLCQQSSKQPQHIATSLLTHKAHRLNNSMYSTEDMSQHIDYEKQNKQLKEEIFALKQIVSKNESLLKQQLQQMTQKLKQKQSKIIQLQQKIRKIQSQVSRKNQNIKEKLIQCQDIVKELEEKKTKSNAHQMLETSRIQKLSFIDDFKPQSFVKMPNETVPQRIQPLKNIKEPSGLANYSSEVNTLRNLNESGQVRVYRNEENNRIIRNIDFSAENNRRHTPEIRFNMTPPRNQLKNQAPMNPGLVRPQSYINLSLPQTVKNINTTANNHSNPSLTQGRISSRPLMVASSPTAMRKVFPLTSPQPFTPVQRGQHMPIPGTFASVIQNNVRYVPQK